MNNTITVLILVLMGAQFGIALTASIVVHPILRMVKKETAIEVFKPFFNKTHRCVLILSIITTLIALMYSTSSGNWWWFGIAMLMHLNGPYTLYFMMPTNRRLMNKKVDPLSEQTARDIQKWGGLHLVRTILNGLIFVAFIVLAVYTI